MKDYTKKILYSLYRQMLKARICEESLVDLIINGDLRCPVHMYTGQEAVAAGICAALFPEDYIFGTHRSHGHFLSKGGCIKALICEIYGNIKGCCKGRGGSMHVMDPGNNIMGAVPIVGGTISLALGSALASLIRKEQRVTVSFFGDGATGQGVLFESLNFAALKHLPLVFVCENNLYSTHMPISECRPNIPISEIGKAFGISSYDIDGNDVLLVYETAKKAIDKCRNGNGPAFIECFTYRQKGHVGPDDNVHGTHTDIRPTAEVDAWLRKDPIKRFEKYLIENGTFVKEELQHIKTEIEKEVKEAHDFAKRCSYPAERDLSLYVFKK